MSREIANELQSDSVLWIRQFESYMASQAVWSPRIMQSLTAA
jgi:hypothetical protein